MGKKLKKQQEDAGAVPPRPRRPQPDGGNKQGGSTLPPKR